MDKDLQHFCTVLFGLYCVYVWNSVSCGHSPGHRRCELSNFDKPFVWRKLSRRAGYRKAKGKLLNFGPMLTEEYDPSIGYEPYWADGDWVFQPPDTEDGDACGVQCPPAYREYGKICGVERNKWNQLTYKTFDTYCDLLSEDCTGQQHWFIAYRGPCKDEIRTFPTQANAIQPRVASYLTALSDRWPQTTSKHRRGVHTKSDQITKKI